jgi:hypothetical protein
MLDEDGPVFNLPILRRILKGELEFVLVSSWSWSEILRLLEKRFQTERLLVAFS